MIDHANGTPAVPMPEPPRSALSQLSAQDRAQIEAWGRDALAENFARAHLTAYAANQQTQMANHLGALARLALAHVLARYHRGLVDQHGHAVSLGMDIALESQWAALLPGDAPNVDVIALDAKGAPWTSPQQGKVAVLRVSVSAAPVVVQAKGPAPT